VGEFYYTKQEHCVKNVENIKIRKMLIASILLGASIKYILQIFY
jgi:hypothetical protein